MAMNEHLHLHKKTGSEIASKLKQSQFQSRPFVVQPQTEEQSEQPDIKTALQRAKRYGHRLDRIKFSEALVQRPVPRIMQAKLAIGEPGDRYEQEADSVAASVVQQINAPVPQQSTQSQSVQREATPDEEDELMKKPDMSAIQRQEEPEAEIQAKPEITALQRQEEPEAEIQAKPNVSDLMRSPSPTQVQREAMPEDEELQTKSILQRREAIGGGEASTHLESAINSAKGGGQPLEAGLQRSMGQAMGADFSGVKVHTDAQADQLNQSIQARAFTTGQDVFFRSGEYNPGSRGGQELIAHELTHVVQQNGGAVQRALPPVTEQTKKKEADQRNRKDHTTDISGVQGQVSLKSDPVVQRKTVLYGKGGGSKPIDEYIGDRAIELDDERNSGCKFTFKKEKLNKYNWISDTIHIKIGSNTTAESNIGMHLNLNFEYITWDDNTNQVKIKLDNFHLTIRPKEWQDKMDKIQGATSDASLSLHKGIAIKNNNLTDVTNWNTGGKKADKDEETVKNMGDIDKKRIHERLANLSPIMLLNKFRDAMNELVINKEHNLVEFKYKDVGIGE